MPSLEEVIPRQSLWVGTDVSFVHVVPESEEVQMYPLAGTFPRETVAASLVPSLEDVMSAQDMTPPTEVSLVQARAALAEEIAEHSRHAVMIAPEAWTARDNMAQSANPTRFRVQVSEL